MKKRKILVLADSPTVATGFAQVSRNVLQELHASGQFEIDMIGINYDGSFNRKEFEEKYPYLNTLVPAQRMGSNDMYGREYAIQALTGRVRDLKPPYDIFFTIQDHFIIEAKSVTTGMGFAESIKTMQRNTLLSKAKENHFVWIGYYPVDGKLKKNWVDNAIAKTDFPVAYCEFGKEEMMKFATKENQFEGRVDIIKHGTNTDDFYPLPASKRKQVREKHFGKIVKEDTFLIINVNRNQIRKDLMRTLLTYKEFKKKVPNSFLYLHCNATMDQGGNIYDIARSIGLDVNDFAVPMNFDERHGVPIKTVNELYNCADAVLTTTLGEGWGLSITEAMATKTPIFAPNITSIPEILNTNGGFKQETARGFAFDSGKNIGDVVCFGSQDNEVVRPVSDIEDAVEKLVWAYNNKKKTEEIVERAYDWARKLTWKEENKKWMDVFKKAGEINDVLRKRGAVEVVDSKIQPVKVKRNDPCPLCLNNGKSIKVKKCEQHRDVFL